MDTKRITVLAGLVLGACSAATTEAGHGLGKADDGSQCGPADGAYDQVDFTSREAELAIDLVENAAREVLDTRLDADTIDALFAARGTMCSMEKVASVREMGPANMAALRNLTALWDLKNWGTPIDELVGEEVVVHGVHFSQGEAKLGLAMANYASIAQLDALPGFHADTARAIVKARRRRERGDTTPRFGSLDELARVRDVGPAHLEMLKESIAEWQRYVRALDARCERPGSETVPSRSAGSCGTLSDAYDGFETPFARFDGEETALALGFAMDAEEDVVRALLPAAFADDVLALRVSAHCNAVALSDLVASRDEGDVRALENAAASWDLFRASGEADQSAFFAGQGGWLRTEREIVLHMANTATVEQLDAIAFFRSDVAEAVVASRPFSSVEDVEGIRGLGTEHLEYLRGNAGAWRTFVRERRATLGCETVIESNGFTREAREFAARELDNICPDTFCGGDHNYYVTGLECDGEGACTVSLRAQPYYLQHLASDAIVPPFSKELEYSPEAGADAPAAQLVASVTSEAVQRDDDESYVALACEIRADYRGDADIVTTSASGHRSVADALYNHLVFGCVHAFDDYLATAFADRAGSEDEE